MLHSYFPALLDNSSQSTGDKTVTTMLLTALTTVHHLTQQQFTGSKPDAPFLLILALNNKLEAKLITPYHFSFFFMTSDLKLFIKVTQED